ncbi:MAG: helix-turn-helix transcriptional regulator [Syntrophomonadaceae bacterium]|nr:helix-turn-helix transcriptional regulator [Syntrophomonadaceae bacterium]
MRLKELRKKAELTQRELAGLLGVAQNTISQWELGEREPDNDTLKSLAKFFGVSTDYLLNDNNLASDDTKQHVNDEEALEFLEELHKRPEMKALFQVGRKATKQDIETAITIIEALKKKGSDSD